MTRPMTLPPITYIGYVPNILVIHPSVAANTLTNW